MGLWGSSATDIYAVGNYYYGGLPPDGTVLHYNGSTWSECYRPAQKPLTGIWGTSSHDIWAVGTGGTIVHYNGSIWSIVNSGTTKHLSDVWGSSGTNIFVVGSELFSGNGVVLHYDGSIWSEILNDAKNEFYGVWGMGASEVFVVGGIGNSTGIILHYEEETATSTTTSMPSTAIELSSFTATSAGSSIILKWETESEANNAGFNIYRAESENGEYIKINSELIPGEGLIHPGRGV